MFELKGKKVLLTGGTSGIGKQILSTLSELEAVITTCGTREEALSSIASEFKVNAVKADLSDREQVNNLVDTAYEKMGGIDALVCNAGITDDKLLLRMSDESWDKVININLTSTFLLNRRVARIMSRQRYGRIINMSSVVAFAGNPGQVNYVASKSGMVGMTKSIALELAGRNVTANCIAPGFIKTPMTDKLSDAQVERALSKVPLGCIGEPGDIAAAVVFLMSDEAKYITAQTLHINGGML